MADANNISTDPPPRGSRASRWISVLLLALVVAWAAPALWQDATRFRASGRGIAIVPLILGVAAYVAFYALMFLNWTQLTKGFGIQPPLRPAARIWFRSQLGRYLPGKAAMPAYRFYAYASELEAPVGALSVVVALEQLSILATGGVISAAAVLILGAPSWVPAPGVLVTLGVGFGLICHPRVVAWWLRRVALRRGDGDAVVVAPPWTLVARTMAIHLLAWLCFGSAVALAACACAEWMPAGWSLTLIGVSSSYLGLVALFAPSGIGVRDAALAWMLTPLIGAPAAAAGALLSRLALTTADFIVCGVLGYMPSRHSDS